MKKADRRKIARIMVSNYKRLGKSPQDVIFRQAIDTVIERTSKLDNGTERLKAVKMVCIDRTHTTAGAASAIHYSYWTVLNFVKDFLDDVSVEAGFYEAGE